MGNSNALCCRGIFYHNKQETVPQSEREALLRSVNPTNASAVDEQPTSLQKSVLSEDPTDLQNKIDNTDVCNNGAVPTKSFSPQSSTVIRAGLESEEYDVNIQQLKSDHQEQVCAVQQTDVVSELIVPPVLERTANLQDQCSNFETQESVNFSLQALTESGPDLDVVKIEKDDALSSAQQVESESDFQKLAVKVQDTSVTSELKPAPDVNGIANVEDRRVGSDTWESIRSNTSEQPEQGEKCALSETVQNDESSTVMDSVSQEHKSGLLTESTAGTYSSDMEDSAKRARLSHGSDLSDSSHQGEHGHTQVVLPEDEEGAKKLQNRQSDCAIKETENSQQSEEPTDTCVKVTERVSEEPDLPELKGNLFNNEKNICEAVTKETHENVKGCNQECIDGEEDLYRDEDEIEKEKSQRLLSENQLAAVSEKSTVEPGMDILEYCTREWKGNTAKAQLMIKAYEAVREIFSSVRRVRGDNYCALRATLFQALSNVELPSWLQQDDLVQIPEKLIAENNTWIKQWHFGVQDSGNENPVKTLKGYLAVLKQKWTHICGMDSLEERQAACEEVFRSDTEEYRLYEAMKIVMLAKAIELDGDKVQEREVPLFCWLLFARDTSTDPYHFMKNHLNHIGCTGGLDQVEMFLLGYSLQLTIRVFRLYKFGTDEFVTFYPDDHKEDWPTVTLVTEDDRHYNVPVGDAEVTYL
ncbi:fap1 adhesin-like [Heptranchias perlo]|uniref:fap1 adhesin-like n=1 Tax=Heptranchias perlo TaxID=212740 RepID=UPI00355AAFC0